MLDHLNPRTRGYIESLLAGEEINIGGTRVPVFSEFERIAITVVSGGFDILEGLKGAALAEEFAELYGKVLELNFVLGVSTSPSLQVIANEIADELGPSEEEHSWRINTVSACSFRGLAPAGEEWNFDFQSRSHLFHGPNGCGKSSLLGAISWCLTGRIFRDDGPPSVVETVTVYRRSGDKYKPHDRSDALSLLRADESSTDTMQEYWVELVLVDEKADSHGSKLFLRRHSKDGLSCSGDGQSWKSISTTNEAGINELDSELQILMPARVSHLRFGKNQDITHLFSQIVGLDDLEEISEIASKACTALRSKSTKIQNSEIAPLEGKIVQAITAIQFNASSSMTETPEYISAISPSRSLADVEKFETLLNNSLERLNAKLAADLGIVLPDADAEEFKQVKLSLKNLPGLVQAALETLDKPVEEIFASTFSLPSMTNEVLEKLESDLAKFESDARSVIEERLEWENEITKDEKVPLMLAAAGHFCADSNDCPVCTQDLENVPAITEQLSELRSKSKLSHLKKQIDDLERSLVEQLDEIISPDKRSLGEKNLINRAKKDWAILKKDRFTGLLAVMAEKFDSQVLDLVDTVPDDSLEQRLKLTSNYDDLYPEAFERLDGLLTKYFEFVSVIKVSEKHRGRVRDELARILKGEGDEGESDSLRWVLDSGRATSEEIDVIMLVRNDVRSLYENQKKIDDFTAKSEYYSSVAGALEATKELGKPVRKETVNTIKTVWPGMRELYKKLYDTEILPLSMLTAGHAANPDIKSEINAYLNSGSELVPIGAFSNAGRLRALGLAFVFALLEKSNWSLDTLILDDPAVSLDDEHQARFVSKLVADVLNNHQVILATHYERFFERAEPVFNEHETRRMPPRRTSNDGVSFEPADLLQRLETAFGQNTTAWREHAINLRIWVERTLATISGYCPTPFTVFNNFPATINGYGGCTDPRIATPDRDKIVTALNSAEFSKFKHKPAHNLTVIEADVRDALTVLKGISKNTRYEIERLKTLSRHDLLNRALDARPSVEILSLKNGIVSGELPFVGLAAASTSGSGIEVEWAHNLTLQSDEYELALVKLDTIAPIANIGQVLLLDSSDSPCASGDLVIAKTDDGDRYIRRYWMKDEKLITLECANPTSPYEPISLTSGKCEINKIVGVLYETLGGNVGGVGDEWVTPRNSPQNLFQDLLCVEVSGTSMEPIARDKQTVLIREASDPSAMGDGDLACVDAKGVGVVIKRCYFSGEHWFLGSINQNDSHPPILLGKTDIRKVHLLKGILF